MTKRILVVEDQEDLRGVLRDLLTGSGYEVVEAADGGEGVAKAKSERPDLILIDIQLPVLDGYETTRQIKADSNLKATPIIAVSSYARRAMRRRLVRRAATTTSRSPIVLFSCCASSEAFWARRNQAAVLYQPTMTTAHRAESAGGGRVGR